MYDITKINRRPVYDAFITTTSIDEKESDREYGIF